MAKKLGDSMANGCNCNFWNTVKKMNGKTTELANTVDSTVGENDVCEVFSNKYKSLYNSVSYNTREIDVLKLKIKNLIKTTCVCWVCYASHSVYVTNDEEAIKHLKSSKSDGSIPGMSDYVINGTKRLLSV